MHHFYAPQLAEGINELTHEESKHCIKVLRMQMGDKISLTDGMGTRYLAELENEDHRACMLKILSATKQEKPEKFSIHIAFSPVKQNDRNEWFLEKATELGVDEISILICEHSERQKINMERYSRIMVEALKQSLSNYLPDLNEPVSFADFIALNKSSNLFFAHCQNGKKKKLNELFVNASGDVIVMIGPEGDFSAAEINKIREMNLTELSLGQQRLRTETAAMSIAMAAMLARS